MSPDEFRAAGREVVEWVASYLERIETFPVLSRVAPGDIRRRLPAHPPQSGEASDGFASRLLADVDGAVLPGITHWQHPSFFGYFPANASGPAMLGDLLASGLGVQGMSWITSPACTELEQVVVDWLADLLGLPAGWHADGPGGGVIQDTASTATFTAVLAALHRASDGRTATEGVGSGRYAVYTSIEAHSAGIKAARMAGLGSAAVRQIEVDAKDFAMSVPALAQALAADRAADVTPAIIIATVGTTSTTAIDPIRAIGTLAREHGVWLHVDAAYAGVAAVCPELRWILDGVGEFADSMCTNPHKWLLTNFDCDVFWVADRTALTGALSVLPEFLRNAATDSGAVVDYRDWHPQLGRRFRALKLWAVLRWYGADGLQAHIRRHVELAQAFASWVRDDARFVLVAPHPLSLVCFRVAGDDDAADRLTSALLDALNAGGRLFVTHTRVGGRMTIRLAIGGLLTTGQHVRDAWRDIQEAADSILTA
ncbi:MAG: aspartate aminotransferase family protein [Pseudonocardiales bacterium]|nr:MAG: aspartate aminotransferase family protein [Pseudonocardiales bacterium]